MPVRGGGPAAVAMMLRRRLDEPLAALLEETGKMMEIECRSVFTCHRHKSSVREQLVMKKRGDLVYTSKLSNSNTSNRLCTTSSGLGSGPCPWQLSRLQGSLSLSRPRCGGNRGVRSAEETAAARLRASFLNTKAPSRLT